MLRQYGALLTILLFSAAIGCAKKVANDDCVQRLPERIHVGDSEAFAENVLDRCGFTYSFDQTADTIFAIKRGETKGLVRQDWAARVKVDERRNVTSVKVEKTFTGP